MAGDPDYDAALAILRGLPAAGVDLIELGMPFTDPMADGPAIQRAGQRALAAGQTMDRTLAMVRAFREADADDAAGADGLLQPDLLPRRRRASSPRRRRPASTA